MNDQQLQAFVERLAQTTAPANAYNHYAHGNPYNEIRRANLLCYLRHMAERQPGVMLVMEAPGYRGCRLTGIPVMSRKLLLEGVPALDMFGAQRGYQDVPEPEFAHIQSEQTATIMWQTLSTLGRTPMIWSTFPFHPHAPNQSLSNRPPLKSDIQIGLPFLREMLEMFNPQHLIAVGNVGDAALTALGKPHDKIRHPAQGGKNDFVAGITRLCATL